MMRGDDTAELLRSRRIRCNHRGGQPEGQSPIRLHSLLDLFIHAVAEAIREEMVDWLREKYPGVKILALNLPGQQLSNVDFNALNGPENWLSIVTEQLANSAESPGPNKVSTTVA